MSDPNNERENPGSTPGQGNDTGAKPGGNDRETQPIKGDNLGSRKIEVELKHANTSEKS